MLEKWKHKLELSDWGISTVSIYRKQVMYPDDIADEDKFFIGVCADVENKTAIIYHDVPLYEEAVVHELLHVKYPLLDEKNINKITKIKLMGEKLKVYYAHFMGIYNTVQEERDIQLLTNLGFNVVNPNIPSVQTEVDYCLNEYKDLEDGYMKMFDTVFFSRVRNCEIFAFRPLPDGRIPGGVAMELKVAQEEGKMIIELPCGTHARSMGKDDTREYLRDLGQR